MLPHTLYICKSILILNNSRAICLSLFLSYSASQLNLTDWEKTTTLIFSMSFPNCWNGPNPAAHLRGFENPSSCRLTKRWMQYLTLMSFLIHCNQGIVNNYTPSLKISTIITVGARWEIADLHPRIMTYIQRPENREALWSPPFRNCHPREVPTRRCC